MDSIRLGIIGFGTWPREAYAPALIDMPGAQVAAVAARSEATRDLARGSFGAGLITHSDYTDLLADDSIDAVILALPGVLHAEALRAALQTDKHVLYEPPIALDRATAEELIAACAAHPRVVRADLELRCLPVMRFLLDKLASGDLGRPLMAKVRLWCDWGFGGCQWLDEAEHQGFFPWLGSWYLDVLDQVFPEDFLSVDLTGGYAMNRTLMDHLWASFRYPSGVGQFEFNMTLPQGQEVTVHVAAERGEITADLWDGACRWRGEDGTWQETVVAPAQPVAGFSGMRESLSEFVASVRDGRPCTEDIEIMRRVHRALFACHELDREQSGGPVGSTSR